MKRKVVVIGGGVHWLKPVTPRGTARSLRRLHLQPQTKACTQQTMHIYDDDACCTRCGFDGAEWSHWKRNTWEGRASDARMPLCNDGRV